MAIPPRSMPCPSDRVTVLPSSVTLSLPLSASALASAAASGTAKPPVVKPQSSMSGYTVISNAPPVVLQRDSASATISDVSSYTVPVPSRFILLISLSSLPTESRSSRRRISFSAASTASSQRSP